MIQSDIWDCGPASLATVLNNMGISATQDELASLAGTDETGTSLYGLKIAAQSKGVTAIGARLTIDQLLTNNIVVLSINGVNHFDVVQNITNTTVYLFDPNLGNIQMTRDKFNELYIGIALLINEQAPANATILTDDEMRNIKGSWHWEKVIYLNNSFTGLNRNFHCNGHLFN
ncbi:cysteine peptidase family C39 domain-containing protein [Methanobacterium sp.]|uniref:cysteine peptidase family C39 domain-containing protein n=1 Tax=Methanobacterium sp. TaxID=2164 RepID=UPI003159364E